MRGGKFPVRRSLFNEPFRALRQRICPSAAPLRLAVRRNTASLTDLAVRWSRRHQDGSFSADANPFSAPRSLTARRNSSASAPPLAALTCTKRPIPPGNGRRFYAVQDSSLPSSNVRAEQNDGCRSDPQVRPRRRRPGLVVRAWGGTWAALPAAMPRKTAGSVLVPMKPRANLRTTVFA